MKTLLSSLLVASLLGAALGHTDATQRVRGTVTAFGNGVLKVKVPDGRETRVQVTERTAVSYPKAIRLSDIKAGDFVGTAAMPDSEGRLVAREVHLFPEAARGTGEGHYVWDSEAGSTMTNASVAKKVAAAKGQELTLEYKGGSRQVTVPPGVPVVAVTPADVSLLVPGRYVFVVADVAADGSLTAKRIMVEKDGVKPPM